MPPADQTSPPYAPMPRWVETATAVLLSVAGLTTAWASYQASLWGGEQMTHYSAASAKLTNASQLDIVAGQTAAVDTTLFLSWADAAFSGEDDRAAFLAFRFSPAFSEAFKSWRVGFPESLEGFTLPEGAKPGSFMPVTTYPQSAKAAALRVEATQLFVDGEEANSISDRFVAITVLLSTVLFLGGISQLMKRPRPRIGMVVLASALCVGAVGWMLTLPSAAL
jgi:hypothetical protein